MGRALPESLPTSDMAFTSQKVILLVELIQMGSLKEISCISKSTFFGWYTQVYARDFAGEEVSLKSLTNITVLGNVSV